MSKKRFVLKSTWKLLLISLFVMAHAAGCSRQASDKAQGYLEGRYTYLATNVSGKVEKLLIERGDRVQGGQLLLSLEQQPESDAYQASLENLKQSISELDSIKANLNYAKITYERNKTLVAKRAIEISSLDNATANYNSLQAQYSKANANIAQLKADLAKAKWTLDQKIIVAPKAGLIFDIYYRRGEYIKSQQAIISLLAPEDIKAIFYVNQATLGRIKLKNPVTIECDGCSKNYTGYVSFISPTAEYTPPVIFSEQTNEKLIYRIEAKFQPEDAYQLHPGQPITVIYDR